MTSRRPRWVCLNKGTAGVLVYPTNPKGIELYYHANVFFCLNGKTRLLLKSSRLEIQNNSFSRLGLKLWNKIPLYITDHPKRTFKRVLGKLLFDILEKEDDHIQIPMIIQKVDT